jgi:hypothetical protein
MERRRQPRVFFRGHGRFPRTPSEIDPTIVADVAQQLGIEATANSALVLTDRTTERIALKSEPCLASARRSSLMRRPSLIGCEIMRSRNSAAGELIFTSSAHRPLRAASHWRAHQGWSCCGKGQGAQARSTTRRSRQARCSLEADRSRLIADRSGATGRTRTRHGLQGGTSRIVR